MLNNRYGRILMTVIAVSLLILAFSSVMEMVSSNAQAQQQYNTAKKTGPLLEVLQIRNVKVENLKNIYVMEDNRTFITQTTGGFTVYTVDYIPRKK
jgi:Na+/melibiose symporter-like transporter